MKWTDKFLVGPRLGRELAVVRPWHFVSTNGTIQGMTHQLFCVLQQHFPKQDGFLFARVGADGFQQSSLPVTEGQLDGVLANKGGVGVHGESSRTVGNWVSCADAALAGLHADIRGDQAMHLGAPGHLINQRHGRTKADALEELGAVAIRHAEPTHPRKEVCFGPEKKVLRYDRADMAPSDGGAIKPFDCAIEALHPRSRISGQPDFDDAVFELNRVKAWVCTVRDRKIGSENSHRSDPLLLCFSVRRLIRSERATSPEFNLILATIWDNALLKPLKNR